MTFNLAVQRIAYGARLHLRGTSAFPIRLLPLRAQSGRAEYPGKDYDNSCGISSNRQPCADSCRENLSRPV